MDERQPRLLGRLVPRGPLPYQHRVRATLNGETIELPDGLTVAGLLTHLSLRGERVAVERNGLVIKRARHAEEQLASGDVLEVVSFVGGG